MVKYKNRASTARELPDLYMGFCRLKHAGPLIACDTAFYALIVVNRLYCMVLFHSNTRRHMINSVSNTPRHVIANG